MAGKRSLSALLVICSTLFSILLDYFNFPSSPHQTPTDSLVLLFGILMCSFYSHSPSLSTLQKKPGEGRRGVRERHLVIDNISCLSLSFSIVHIPANSSVLRQLFPSIGRLPSTPKRKQIARLAWSEYVGIKRRFTQPQALYKLGSPIEKEIRREEQEQDSDSSKDFKVGILISGPCDSQDCGDSVDRHKPMSQTL